MLTPEQIEALAEEHGSDIDGLVRAVEAEVRKQDTALIQRLLNALEHIQRCIGFGTATIHWNSATWSQIDAAATAANERLKP